MDKIKIIGNSLAIQMVQQLIHQVAKTQANVMILGGSGTGKELVARAIHQNSSRVNYPFVAVNCAAIPLELLESELFGHEKGAFTGAHQTRMGRFEVAKGGTLFLDEIGDMPLVMQAKLLRVLQDKTFERVGGNKSIQTDVRVITATHKNLLECIELGNFREDLYYRLNVFPIEVPLLKDRASDIPLLIQHYIEQYRGVERAGVGEEKIRASEDKIRADEEKRENEKTGIEFTEAALSFLMVYEWPGNVRELANLLERLMILFRGKLIDVSDLPVQLFQKPAARSFISRRENKDFTILTAKDLPSSGFDLKDHLAQLEFDYILKALNEYQGIVARAAKRLGLRRTTLVEKMKKYGIDRSQSG